MLSRVFVRLGGLGLLGGWVIGLSGRVAQPAQAEPLSAPTPHAGFPRTEVRSYINFVSPSVVDVNGDGSLEVLVADGVGCVYAWNSQGQLLAGFPWQTGGSCKSNAPRILNSLAIGDINQDGGLEIAAGTRGRGEAVGERGRVYVWSADGQVLWTREMVWETSWGNGQPEVSSVVLADIDGEAGLEVLAGTTNNASGTSQDVTALNLYAWSAGGAVFPGFPAGYRTAGIYNSIAAADLDGNGAAEIVPLRDHRYFNVYTAAGAPGAGFPVQMFLNPANTSGAYAEFTFSVPSLGDLDGNGSLEIVMAGKVRDTNRKIVNSALFVLEADGQRHVNWTTPQLGQGAPLYNNYEPSQGPALADLDGNGTLEIVVATLDGYIQVYDWQGRTLWRYRYAQGRALFASEPVIGDVSGDGQVDIVFGVYNPNSGVDNGAYVGVYGLDARGVPLAGFPLALTQDSGKLKGVRAAPTLADLDQDGLVEILASSWGGTLYVWDTAAPYQARQMPWPTGRHDNCRSGLYAAAAALRAAAPAGPAWVAGTHLIYFPVIAGGVPEGSGACGY